jgi:transposase
MGDELMMSGKERRKLVELKLVEEGRQTLGEAARRLGVCYRQVRRVWRRFREVGVVGLVHRSRGRPSNRGKGEAFRDRCLGLYREQLAGWGPTLASEKLAEWGLRVDHETLRRWFVAEGLWQRQRKRGPHRQRRPRKERFGELVQLDGSYHDWFGDGGRECLLDMVDDATGKALARMEEEETTAAAMRVLWAWIVRYGIPWALYVDRKTVYVTEREPTVEEQLAGEAPLTAFGKTCAKLGIEIIPAFSPQAKGRVERRHGVFQDRLVKEVRLLGISSIQGANELLEGGFVDSLNEKFARPPLHPEDCHRPVPKDVDLAAIFVFEESRTVANDWTVRYENRFFQLTGPKEWLPRPKARVVMQRRLDSSLHILYRGRELIFREVPLEARLIPRQAPPPPPTVPRHQKSRPADDHPWRRPFSPRSPFFRAQHQAQPAPPRGSSAP